MIRIIFGLVAAFNIAIMPVAPNWAVFVANLIGAAGSVAIVIRESKRA